MKELDPGHIYSLDLLDEDWQPPYTPRLLQFVKREGPNYPGNKGHFPGTNIQEVVRCLIARAKYLNHQIPCWQTRLSIYLLATVNWLYEYRAAKRHHRSIPSFWQATYGPTCSTCGHVGCRCLDAHLRAQK